MPQVVVGVGVGIVVHPLFVAREESLGGKESAFQRASSTKNNTEGPQHGFYYQRNIVVS